MAGGFLFVIYVAIAGRILCAPGTDWAGSDKMCRPVLAGFRKRHRAKAAWLLRRRRRVVVAVAHAGRDCRNKVVEAAVGRNHPRSVEAVAAVDRDRHKVAEDRAEHALPPACSAKKLRM